MVGANGSGGVEQPEAATLRELLEFVRPFKVAMAGSLVLGICATSAALAQPLAVGSVLEAVRAGSPILEPAALLVLLFAADAVLSSLQGYLLGKIGEGVVLNVRRALVQRLLNMTVPEHDKHRTGDLISRVGNDTTLLRTALAQSLTSLLIGALTLVGAVVLMAVIDPLLLSVALLCVFLATAGIFLISVKVRAVTEEAQHSVGALGAALERALRAIRTVKISKAEEREQETIMGEASSAYRAGVRAAKLQSFVAPMANIAVQGSFVLVLGVGGARLAAGTLALEDLVAFLLYLLYLVAPLVAFFMALTELQQGLAAVRRLNTILAAPVEEPEEEPKPFVMPSAETRNGGKSCDANHNVVVQFEEVIFAYVPGRPVLRGVSFEVCGPGLTALVGPSGAGKSTVFALLERFYGFDAGKILLEGEDIRRLPLAELRDRIGYVEQDSPVMAGSVRDNLLYANPYATEAQLEEVLRLANLHGFVGRLPDGLDTEVGEGGALLSGGERQRIAIARMLLHRPRLLLLDEVTSQLDAANERALRDTISQVSQKCAVMVIAHRLSTVTGASKIVVLSDGEVKAVGTHTELMSTDPLYRELVNTQLIDANGSIVGALLPEGEQPRT